MHSVATPDPGPRAAGSAHDRIERLAYAVGAIAPPVLMLIAWAAPRSVKGGAQAAITYAASHSAQHTGELLLGPLGGVLALLGVIGLARMSMNAAPWLTLTGSLLAIAGWGTMPIWIGQDTLTYLIGRRGADQQMIDLWNQFNTNAVTNAYLSLFIVGHLIGPLLLGIALRRARLVPRWTVILLAANIPFHIATFVTGIWVFHPLGYLIMTVALAPAAAAILRFEPRRPLPGSADATPAEQIGAPV